MAKIRTYVDSGVLITAARFKTPMAVRAHAVLDDTQRSFVSSPYVPLKVLPKAIYYKLKTQVDFYNELFSNVEIWANEVSLEAAFEEALKSGLSAIDALHVVTAHSVKAKEFITTERPTTLLHQTSLVKVITIY